MQNAKATYQCEKCLKQCGIFWHDYSKFDSTSEFQRFKKLKESKKIINIQRQKEFVLYAFEPYFLRGGKVPLGKFTADFIYQVKETGLWISEDWKGCRAIEELMTDDIKWRVKIANANYPKYKFIVNNNMDLYV